MRKDYQKAARGSIYAIAVMIAGMCFSASPAQSSTCFLPSGNCVTGKIDTKQDGGNETIEYCNGYDISESEYNKKYNNTSCFSCGSPCTRTSGGTFYKCETVNNTKWYDDYNVCCTNGTKYDKDDKACCPSGGCNHPCPAGKSWSKALQNCVCPSSVETDGNGNCCASGQVLDENKNCTTPCTMNDCSSYPYTIDPGNSEKCNLGCNKGTRYKCKSGYTYSGGKCVEPPAPTPTPKCTDVAATENKLEEIHQYETISAKKTEDITSAELGCGKNPIYAKEGGIGKDSSSWDYHYQSGPGPIYRMDSTTGKWYVNYSGRCMENLRCGAVVGEGYTDYTSFDNSGKYYCCKQNVLQNNRSYSESEINSILNQSCKTKPSGSEKPAPFSPYYVCDKGTMDYNRQCHLGTYSYSCPSGYTLSGEKCINKKANCPTGYKASAKDATSYYCRKTTYTCPTNFDYTLSGDKCYCQKPGACLDYTLTSKKDENCYACATCPTDSSKYKCIENIKSGYQLVNGVCSKKPVEKPTITITMEYDSKNNPSGSSSGSASALIKFTNSASDGKSYTVKLIIDGDGDDGINYPLTVTQGNWVTYESYSYQLSDCEVYGDCRGDDSDNGREFSSNPTATSVIVNGKTVLSDIAAIDKLADKTYTTNDYIIKFVDSRYIDISYTYARDGDSSNTWCFEIMSSSPVKKDITVWFNGSYSCYEVDNTLTGEEHTWGHQFEGSVTIKKGSTGAIGSECWQDGSDNNTTRGCNLDKMNIDRPSWDGVKDSDGYTYYWDYQQK